MSTPSPFPVSPLPLPVEFARRTVPRYTSYPTAPHFTPAVTPDLAAAWLERSAGAGAPVSLYLHVPFCRAICHYCGCATKAALRDEPIRAYAAVLRKEIALLAVRLGRAEVSRIHWGGGTPSLLPPDCLKAIVGDLAERFRLRPGLEHAIELDPRHVTAEGARLLAGLGINRASLGVQSLDPAVQSAIGREQPFQVVADAFAYLRAAGIEAINADLMYGLPHQDIGSVEDSVRRVLSLAPSRVAIFGYAHVPWMRPHQRLVEEAALPDSGSRLAQAAAARIVLKNGDYAEIGIDHFARPDDALARAAAEGRLRRNFQGYTDDEAATLVGIGASSITRTPFGYAQNAADVPTWRRAIEVGRFATTRGKALEGEDALRAEVIETLLCHFEVDLQRIAARHAATPSVFDADLARLRPLVEAGWVRIDRCRVAVLERRHLIARIVAAEFDAYFGGSGRHSAAV